MPQPPSAPVFVQVSGAFGFLPSTSLPSSRGLRAHSLIGCAPLWVTRPLLQGSSNLGCHSSLQPLHRYYRCLVNIWHFFPPFPIQSVCLSAALSASDRLSRRTALSWWFPPSLLLWLMPSCQRAADCALVVCRSPRSVEWQYGRALSRSLWVFHLLPVSPLAITHCTWSSQFSGSKYMSRFKALKSVKINHLNWHKKPVQTWRWQ